MKRVFVIFVMVALVASFSGCYQCGGPTNEEGVLSTTASLVFDDVVSIDVVPNSDSYVEPSDAAVDTEKIEDVDDSEMTQGVVFETYFELPENDSTVEAPSVEPTPVENSETTGIPVDGEYVAGNQKAAETTVPPKEIETAIVYPLMYKDETATITITKEWHEKAWAYIAHLEFTDYTRLGTECANGKYDNGFEKTSHAAERLNAIFAVNGCYSAPYLEYTVVRSGVICNGEDRKLSVPGVYSSHNGLFQSAWGENKSETLKNKKVSELVDAGLVTDTFCFGPPILISGEVVENTDTSLAQRTFMGTNGNPGDLWIVVSDGRRNDTESKGLTYTQCAQLLLDRGCIFGIALDGGGSSTMVFKGKVLNANASGERSVVDFLYFQ